ncbi:CHC2 zinc finger domain-containing protein [Oscillospiraceae bacterium OttesenSCG-928-G22]|nr:CHC2 zinc finger domain-containing protein [Oscillospiraceae bacterium OttesenSCG-928-G22]
MLWCTTSRGINSHNPFRCLSPAHHDEHPSMFFDPKRNKIHCFACGVDYDIFDLLQIDYNLLTAREAFNKAYELFSIGETKSTVQVADTRPSDYLKKRGISDETAKAFSIGFTPRLPDAGGQQTGALAGCYYLKWEEHNLSEHQSKRRRQKSHSKAWRKRPL